MEYIYIKKMTYTFILIVFLLLYSVLCQHSEVLHCFQCADTYRLKDPVPESFTDKFNESCLIPPGNFAHLQKLLKPCLNDETVAEKYETCETIRFRGNNKDKSEFHVTIRGCFHLNSSVRECQVRKGVNSFEDKSLRDSITGLLSPNRTATLCVCRKSGCNTILSEIDDMESSGDGLEGSGSGGDDNDDDGSPDEEIREGGAIVTERGVIPSEKDAHHHEEDLDFSEVISKEGHENDTITTTVSIDVDASNSVSGLFNCKQCCLWITAFVLSLKFVFSS